MPIGIERLNARHQQPNSRITFIKPLPGPDSKYAQDFLERIAATCHPIMKANHLSIMTLEEYEPNPEFVGRNFNAGEIIQLVLKAPYSGHWLSFRSVQMVMMHELAHCMQMNHSAAFWKLRNQYAEELRGLWSKSYTGDGFWGQGKTILSEQYENIRPPVPEVMPKSLCGGTFRSRGRKRKRKADAPDTKSLTYAERQQRRIAKKFGTNGVALGDDEATKIKLEHGVKVKGKPRVAGSARGRELRAQAALARFSQQKEEETTKAEATLESGSETEDDYDSPDGGQEALNAKGAHILDRKGNTMIRVCEDEDRDDIHVKQEMQELQDLEDRDTQPQSGANAPARTLKSSSKVISNAELQCSSKHSTPDKQMRPPAQESSISSTQKSTGKRSLPVNEAKVSTCPICSMENDPAAATCMACSHVLDTGKVHDYWACNSSTCSGSRYLNADDSALCGVCGSRRQNV